MRIGEGVFDYPVATVRLRIRQAVKQTITLRVFHRVLQVTFFLMAECLAIGDQKLKVARVRLIDPWIVNLIHDAVTEREPETATGMISCAHAFLRARSPAGLDSGRAKRRWLVLSCHLYGRMCLVWRSW